MLKIAAIGSLGMLIMWTAAACSSHDNQALLPIPAAADPSNLFSPVGLVEVRRFTDMPDGEKKLADGFMNSNSENSHPKFLAGGFSDSSAIAAYERPGYVPYDTAEAYVKTASGWVFAKGWENIGEVADLRGLLIATQSSSHNSVPKIGASGLNGGLRMVRLQSRGLLTVPNEHAKVGPSLLAANGES